MKKSMKYSIVFFIMLCCHFIIQGQVYTIEFRPEDMQMPTKYKEGFVTSPEVKLHYLDWKSDQPALILITGLGDTPYLFESMANALSTDFRVVAYARRDHELSKSFNNKYDNATLVSDLKLLMDSLHIQKANLLGWSMGGNEITGFATTYPNRVDQLVYFEAGYDMSDPGFSIMVSSIPESAYATEEDMQSLEDYRNWYHNFWAGDMEWNYVLEKNFVSSIHIKPDGSVENVPNDTIFRNILSEVMQYHRSYKKINAPALVIYAPTFLHSPGDDPEMLAAYDRIDASIVIPWRNRSRSQVKNQLKNATIVEVPTGSHISFLFLNEELLVKTIREFLKS
ncbi:MAG TPA: alpha/beta hydrolase [Saprospiraceae bacterium]|nr:alpha/beta hydrolase [Saprospiraceae bacterium]